MSTPLDRLFAPRAVVVVGVSENPHKQGRVVLRNLIHAGFQGDIFAVSRGVTALDGAYCVSSIAELPGEVDAAFVALPATCAALAVTELAHAGIGFAIVGASGFAEEGDAAGLARQAALQQALADSALRIVGPNCNGIYSTARRLAFGFNTAHSKHQRQGDIAFISHSGALFDCVAGYLERLGAGLSFFVSAGNEVDLNALDYLHYALHDPATRVIALLLDSVADGVRLGQLAAEAAAKGKSIVCLHVGVSEIGAAAAIAHSSRLAGDAAAYEAMFAAYGIATVASLESLATAAALLSRYGKRSGGLAAVSSSGAGASLLADLAGRYNVPLARIDEAAQARVDAVRPLGHPANPLDLGAFQGAAGAEMVVESIIAAPDIGVVLALSQSFHGSAGHPVVAALAAKANPGRKPILLIAPGGLQDAERQSFEAGGVQLLPDTAGAMEAIAALLAPAATAMIKAGPAPLTTEDATLLALNRQLTEPESLGLLGRWGLDTVRTVYCEGFDAALAGAEVIGWPVVLKGVVPGLAHKSDAGMVKVNLANSDALWAAHQRMGAPRAMIVQEFVQGELEVIAGLTRKPGVGMMLLAGLGGIFAEAIDDVTLWPLGVGRARIERQLAHGRLGRILASPRWTDARGTAALLDALERLQALGQAAHNELAAIDVNPLILANGRAIAVDALVIPATRP